MAVGETGRSNGPSDVELEDRFRYHPPNAEARRRHELVTEHCLALAKLLRDLVPASRGQACALTALEEARMWANQGIATNHHLLQPPADAAA